MSRRYFSIFCLTSVLVSSLRADPCLIAFGKVSGSQAELLTAFDPTKVSSQGVTPLSDRAVYLVNGSNGESYVVRFPGKGVDLAFESFAAQIASESPGAATPLTRQLGPSEAKAVATALRAAPLKAKEKPPASPTKASVAIYLPATPGEKYLADKGVSSLLRDKVVEFARAGDAIKPLDRIKLRSVFTAVFEEGTPAEKQSLLADLQAISPRFKGATLATLEEKVSELIGSGNPSEVAKIVTLAEERLPREIQTQLADKWALCTVLGIKDFGAGNWLVHDGKVFLIDVAEPSNDFKKGTPHLDYDNPQFPFRLGMKPPEMTKYLLGLVTPEMKAYLAGLSVEQLTAHAEKAGLALTPEMVEGARARARLVAAGGER